MIIPTPKPSRYCPMDLDIAVGSMPPVIKCGCHYPSNIRRGVVTEITIFDEKLW